MFLMYMHYMYITLVLQGVYRCRLHVVHVSGPVRGAFTPPPPPLESRCSPWQLSDQREGASIWAAALPHFALPPSHVVFSEQNPTCS